jgi:hypothetical protein
MCVTLSWTGVRCNRPSAAFSATDWEADRDSLIWSVPFACGLLDVCWIGYSYQGQCETVVRNRTLFEMDL